MSKIWILAIGSATLLVAALFLMLNDGPPPPPARTPYEPVSSPPLAEPVESGKASVLRPDESIVSIQDPRLLQDYGTPNTSVKDDLRLVNDVLQRFWLLFKNPDLLQVGSNEEILQSLTGSNPDGIRFISPDHPFIDAQGRLTDRWGTPLFFHPESLTRIEIRSAGPDQTLFTDDDAIHDSTSAIPMH